MSNDKTQHINLTIDGIEVSVPKGTTVYTAATGLGIDIPIFCYHDRMPPFGACRQCLVEVEKMGKLQTSCTLEATEGMVVKTQSQMALDGREGILELLLINHPLDCPICDRGGECPLQDQTLKHGPGQSRFFEEKRHFTKPVPRGPVLMLDRERCVVCARCTRFGDLVAGDHALELLERGFKTEVGTPDGGPAESKFIGNTIMICPVGALTSQVYRFRARPWDNDTVQSSCALCTVGCSMLLDSRDGEIMRTRSKENHALNDIWLCDKGWFGYEFTEHPDRLKTPMIRKAGKLEPASWEEALSLVTDKLKEGGKIGALGGNPLTIEENYLFQKLMREGAKVNNIDHRVGSPLITLDEEGIPPGMEMEIGDCEKLSFAVLLGLDLTEEFPVIWLRIKQAINRGAKVLFIGHYAPEIAPHLKKTLLHQPGLELEMMKKFLPEVAELCKEGQRGALFVGRQYLDSPQRKAILAELLQFREGKSLPLNIMEGKGNSMGARLAGMRPDLGPLESKLQQSGLNAVQMLQEAAKGGWGLLYVAGADPARQYPSKLWSEVRSKLNFLVVQDLFMTKTARQADVVLPTLSFIEKRGSFLNIEGRIQQLNPGKAIPKKLYSDGDIFAILGEKLGIDMAIEPAFTNALQTKRISKATPQKFEASSPASNKKALAATFAPALFDQGERMKHNPHVSQLVKEPRVRLHPSDGAKRSLQDGDRARLKLNGAAIEAKVKLDPSVAEGTAVLPLGFEQLPVRELGVNLLNGVELEIGGA